MGTFLFLHDHSEGRSRREGISIAPNLGRALGGPGGSAVGVMLRGGPRPFNPHEVVSSYY